MEHTRTLSNGKPYEIRERLCEFACDVVNAAQKLHMKGPIAGALSLQLVKSAVSAAANAEEADDGVEQARFSREETDHAPRAERVTAPTSRPQENRVRRC
jgi:hypothetical protein